MTDSEGSSKLRVLFDASSPYSGSTLLPFLLIAHPEMAGIGHTTGWHYEEGEDFRCSCGAKLPECPFLTTVARDQLDAGHPFEYRDFAFDYRLARGRRRNGLLTASIPFFRNSSMEHFRDRIVGIVPAWSKGLARIGHANRTFMETTLRYFDASIFVDGSQAPHRLRHLRRIPGVEISMLHLVRDVRGVVYSNMTKKGWSSRDSALNWLNQQADIARIAAEFPRTMRVFYESLCDETDATLQSIHEFMNVEPMGFGGDFKQGEHHILGNQMRLGDGKIERSRRWETALSAEDRGIVEETCRRFAQQSRGAGIADLVEHYLDG